MTPVLECRHIEKHFTKPVDFHVLKDVNFKITPNEFVSIMGKSGCGKSTLLYILSTMDTEYTGSLYLKGELLTGKPANFLSLARSLHIGFVFQFHYLLSDFSVLDNVMLPARKLGRKTLDEIRHDAHEKLKLLNIGDRKSVV